MAHQCEVGRQGVGLCAFCPLTFCAGETIPIRLFLGGFDLTPTFRDVNKKFNTRYYLNLVLVDEENRRYYKQNEITIFRIPDVRMLIFPTFAPC